ELQRLAGKKPAQVQRAMASVLKSEANRLRGEMASYAKGIQTPLSPLTTALRKGKAQIGPFLSRVMRYQVDASALSAMIGVLEAGDRPVSRSMAILAKRQAKGYRIQVTRKAQKALGAKLLQKYRAITERGQWGMFGGLHSFIPKTGMHASAARPIAEVVLKVQRQRVIANIRRNFVIKISGGRY
ncbi:MAG: hypothetical protein LLG06_01680, partial [Desulfobacteraceae bacterium]|nr:hypothetical protein [Desulfobacteraceae bacterium]